MAETVGWLCDKLSIAILKEYHLREQIRRRDATYEHKDACVGRLMVMVAQRKDLEAELDALLAGIRDGTRARPKVYRQFKLYNDPRYRSGDHDRSGDQSRGTR